MRTSHPHSVLRRSPLAVAIALALVPAAAAAADPNHRRPTATQAGPSVDGPFVVQGSTALPPSPKAAGSPSVFVTDDYLSFGDVQVGNTSKKLTTKLLSNGTADYQIDSIGSYYCGYGGYGGYGGMMCSLGYGPDIQCSTTCQPGVAYPPGTSCSFSFSFSPTFPGYQYTYIPICDNAPGGQPRYIDVQGYGFVPIVNLGPSSWDFGTVRVGQRSDFRSFAISNPSDYPADIGQVQVSPPFEIISNNCTSPMAPFARCNVLVQFVPVDGGPVTGRLVVPSNAPVFYGAQIDGAAKALFSYGGTGSAVATLYGVGLEIASLDAPTTVDLGTQVIGGPALAQAITITNTGDIPLTFQGFTTTAGFGVTSGCPATLAVGASCTLNLSFSADKTGDYSGALVIATDHGAKTVELSARTQPVPAPEIRVTPVSITFGDRVLGSQSAPQRVTVNNVGTAAATITSITITTDFAIQANSCGSAIAAASSCAIDIVFRPVGFGPRFGELAIVDSADGSPHKVNLGGNGCRVPNTMGNRAGTNPCSP